MSLLIRNCKYFDLHQALKMLSVNSSNTFRGLSTNAELSLVNLDAEDTVLSIEEKEQTIEKLRNVSRLNPEHRNIMHDQVPYSQPKAEYHLSVKYRRKMYGKYGSKSGVNPGIMWPTKEDIEERKEYESVAYPFTIQDMVKAEISKQEMETAEIMERQKKVSENMKRLNKWMNDLEHKRADKIKKLTEAKAKKDRLIEEVRRHFGYTVDHRDERFQQVLEQKEKEERRTVRAEKQKQRQDIMMQELFAEAQKKMDKEK